MTPLELLGNLSDVTQRYCESTPPIGASIFATAAKYYRLRLGPTLIVNSLGRQAQLNRQLSAIVLRQLNRSLFIRKRLLFGLNAQLSRSHNILQNTAQTFLVRLRLKLGEPDALAPLAALGVLCGLSAGAIVLSFRGLSEWIITHGVGTGNPEGFESLPALARFVLPLAGALCVGYLFHRLPTATLQVGVGHVMERLAYLKADLPWRNALTQYIGGLVTLCVGHSMGREGPGVHLGAAVSSWIGKGLRAPNNSMRTLIACGTAASIAASFNTPIAGVIFAMEVVMMEYTIVGFTPVIVASVVAAWMARAVYGHDAAFDVPALELTSLLELPYLVFVGVAIGALAAAFNVSVTAAQTLSRDTHVLVRFGLAGLVCGVLACAVPEVMGVGYDTVEAALQGSLPLMLLVTIIIAKFVASTACVGFGLPAGLIAPTLVMGATAGALLGALGHAAAPELSSSPGLYAMLGMGAMMGAVLQAPLAALMAILELTANVNIILPGMVCIVSATLTCLAVFKRDSIFITMLRGRGIDYFSDPVALALSRSGVSSRMREDFDVAPRHLSAGEALELCRREARWLVVREPEGFRALIHVEALLAFLDGVANDDAVDLLGSTLPRRSTSTISLRATLQEARVAVAENAVQTLCVVRADGSGEGVLCGILTEPELRN
ncbi:MAG: chloride channel protein [Chromatiales bacterium]|jgi:chloride channel protein, CIC family|nr:chloride channel protein [Chromatiales bacterium]